MDTLHFDKKKNIGIRDELMVIFFRRHVFISVARFFQVGIFLKNKQSKAEMWKNKSSTYFWNSFIKIHLVQGPSKFFYLKCVLNLNEIFIKCFVRYVSRNRCIHGGETFLDKSTTFNKRALKIFNV